MKKLPLLGTILTALLFISKISSGQDKITKNFYELICKEWKLQSYEEKGKKFPPVPEQKGDKMIFYKDNKVKSIESGYIQNGIWKYEATKSILTVIDNDTKEKAIMKVIKLTNDECILEYKDPEGTLLKMHMLPVKKV
ncbi:hypothetical protein [Chitinophaga sp. Ak27]|uniref:hypothetical protein n=1 Tax=Chitinophaga sp. Ak27 TaxID=2726116 RepID=UPI00145DAACB|nr:hypothetical protein [Chitinophaga sp. Ak27]NLU93234.1 hypothetical protein [Chitinophaga sp. Ak27]